MHFTLKIVYWYILCTMKNQFSNYKAEIKFKIYANRRFYIRHGGALLQ